MVCSIIELLMATVVKLVNTLDCGSSISRVRVPSVAPDPSDEGFFVVYKHIHRIIRLSCRKDME